MDFSPACTGKINQGQKYSDDLLKSSILFDIIAPYPLLVFNAKWTIPRPWKTIFSAQENTGTKSIGTNMLCQSVDNV